MRKITACSLALAAMVGLSITASISDVRADEKAAAAFEREFKAAKTPLERSKVVEKLDSDIELLKAYEVVLGDSYWRVRGTVINKLQSFGSAEPRAKIAEYMVGIKDEKVRHQMVWAYCNSNYASADELKPIHALLKNPKESDDIKATALRSMWRWLAKPLPVPATADTEQEKAKKEAERKAIQDFMQPILKANFKAYLDFLKHLKTDKDYKKKLESKKPDADARLLLWLTVEGLERLTSEERGDSVDSWEIFWQKVEADKLELKYRLDDEREQLKIGETAVSARTAVREKVKKLTGVHMVFMPDDQSDLYFAPFDREFTQYFKTSSFIKPDGEKWGRANDAESYFYPDAQVAKLFAEQRKAAGGMIGMLTVGTAGYLAMEYAKGDPDGCAFIICIGGWSGNDVMIGGRQQAEQSKREDIKYYYQALHYKDPNGIMTNDEKRFHALTGQYSHRFSDPFDPDIYYLINRLEAAPKQERSGKTTLVDPQYEIKGKGFTVPSLFIIGEDDEAANPGKAKEMLKLFPNGKLVIMKGTSRMPWLEDPITFFDEFETFMKEKKVWERIEKFKADEEKAKGKGGKK